MTSPLLRYIDGADGTRIAWHTHSGSDDDAAVAARLPIVLTNGLSTTDNFWDGVSASLASAYRVVHWNYRGHAKSESARSGDYAVVTHADDLARVTEAVIARGTHASPPLHVAFSMGVTVLLELYRRRPELVGGMVLVAGGADQPRAASALFRVPLVRPALRGALRVASALAPQTAWVLQREPVQSVLFPLALALGAVGDRTPRQSMEHFLREAAAMDSTAYWASARSLAEAHASDVLPTVKVPVVVVAPATDVLASRGDLEALRRSIPGARWLEVPNTTHAILIEAPDAIASAVREVADRVVPR